MNLFKALSFVLGLVSLGFCLWFQFQFESYREFVLNQFYPPKKPRWYPVLLVVFGALTAGIWFLSFSSYTPLKMVVCFMMTLGVIKIWFLSKNYSKLRPIVEIMLSQKTGALQIMVLSSAAVGLGLIVLGFYL